MRPYEFYGKGDVLDMRSERLDLLKVIRRLLRSNDPVPLIDRIIDDLSQPLPEEVNWLPNAQVAEWVDKEWSKWT
jgi:hypothetical protein